MRPTWQVVEDICGPCAAWGPIAVAHAHAGGDGDVGASASGRTARPADRRTPGRAPDCAPGRMTIRTPGRAPDPRSASCSLRGARRTNADWLLEHPPLFGMADGFGAGPLAGTLSRVACREAARLWEAGLGLAGAVEQANEAVRTVQDLAGDHGCGTTLVLAELLDGHAVDLAWVGDSAALLIRPGEDRPHRLTTCERTEGARLCSALGVARPLVRTARAELASGDIVVLTTDGVWEPLGDDLAGILAGDGATSRADLRAAAERACREAAGRGGDNASIVLVAVD